MTFVKAKKTIAQKTLELLQDLAFENTRPWDPDDERWIALDSFDPIHGKSEVSYALRQAYIERDNADHGYVRLTIRGRIKLDLEANAHLKRQAAE